MTITLMGCSIHRRAAKERAEMLQQASLPTKMVKPEDLKELPYPVKKWLTNCGTIGKRVTQTAFVEQKLKMKLKPDQNKWYKGKANQLFTTSNPAFNWTMYMKMSPLFGVKARDKFINGRGEMHIKMNNLITLARAHGPKIDEASLQRYMGEIVWFPSAALSEQIQWEAIDSTSARAIMQVNGIKVSGIFKFNPKGDVVSFSTMRFKDSGPEAERRMWINTVEKTGVMNGVKVPIKTSTTWKLDDGYWTWLKLEITNINLNPSKNEITKP